MAKFNGASTTESSREGGNRISELQREIQYEKRRRIINSSFSEGLVMLSDYSGIVHNRQSYPDTAVIHPETEAIFDARVFNPKEVEEAFFRIESMCQQIKTFCPALNDNKKQELINCMDNLDALRNNLAPYYNSMVKALGNNDNKKQRSERQVGGIGITSAMFGGR